MINDKVIIKNIKDITYLSVDFEFPHNRTIVLTGKNGIGKTSLAKAFNLLDDPNVYGKSSGLNAIRHNSEIEFQLDGFPPFCFKYNAKINALDTSDEIPSPKEIISELPAPYGSRFSHFSLISRYDTEIRTNIAATRYEDALDLKNFLTGIYTTKKFDNLKKTKVGRYDFYFLLRENDYYIREDHLSSGEFFLIQLFRIISSGAKLIFVDELDFSLDASAQVRLYGAIKPILNRFDSRLIVISHSLAFMSTIEDECLYYLEEHNGVTSLEPRSLGYIKSDLYGFTGFDRYILTEDTVLEGFINYIISAFPISPFYQFTVIGVGGVNQLKMLAEKNDATAILSSPENVLCIMDGDTHLEFSKSYDGPTASLCSPLEDIEKFVYLNRNNLFPELEKPNYQKSDNVKKASKTYWKWLTIDKNINKNQIFSKVVQSNFDHSEEFANQLEAFLTDQ